MAMFTSIQDFIFLVAGCIFCAGLVPIVVNQFRVKASTITVGASLMTMVALSLLIPNYFSLGLWLGMSITITNLALWITILGQRLVYGEWTAAQQEKLDYMVEHLDKMTQEEHDIAYFEFQSASREERAKHGGR